MVPFFSYKFLKMGIQGNESFFFIWYLRVVLDRFSWDLKFVSNESKIHYWENTEKYITFSVPIKKELNNNKTVMYKLKFIDSFRFMSTSLSSLVDDLSEIYCKKCSCKSMCDFIELKDGKFNNECKECKKDG